MHLYAHALGNFMYRTIRVPIGPQWHDVEYTDTLTITITFARRSGRFTTEAHVGDSTIGDYKIRQVSEEQSLHILDIEAAADVLEADAQDGVPRVEGLPALCEAVSWLAPGYDYDELVQRMGNVDLHGVRDRILRKLHGLRGLSAYHQPDADASTPWYEEDEEDTRYAGGEQQRLPLVQRAIPVTSATYDYSTIYVNDDNGNAVYMDNTGRVHIVERVKHDKEAHLARGKPSTRTRKTAEPKKKEQVVNYGGLRTPRKVLVRKKPVVWVESILDLVVRKR